MSQATPASAIARMSSSDVHGACAEISPSIRASHARIAALTAGSVLYSSYLRPSRKKGG